MLVVLKYIFAEFYYTSFGISQYPFLVIIIAEWWRFGFFNIEFIGIFLKI